MEQRKIIDIFISVILAILLWSYVINVVNPPQSATVRDLEVQLQGMELLNANGFTIAGDGKYAVDITVSAPRNDLAGITAANFSAYASVANLSAGQNYITVNVTGPDNLTIEDIRSQKIQVYVDELIVGEKPLTVAYSDPSGDFEVTVLDKEYDLVEVRGAKSLVDMVTTVRVDVDTTQLEIDIPQTENLLGIALDKEGNIISNVEIMDSSIAVTSVLYKIKNVPLRVTYSGTPGLGSAVDNFTYPTRINIKGPGEILEAIQVINGKPLNIEGITQDTTYKVEPILPSDIHLAKSSENPYAKVVLLHTGEIGFNYTLSEMEIVSLPEDWKLEYVDPEMLISVTAKGDLDVIRTLDASHLQPLMDLTGYESGTRTVSLGTVNKIEGVTLTVEPKILVVKLISPEDENSEDETSEDQNETQQTETTETQQTEVQNNG
jgi:YbbR domain-containing protein